jgi:hypothetical protein
MLNGLIHRLGKINISAYKTYVDKVQLEFHRNNCLIRHCSYMS